MSFIVADDCIQLGLRAGAIVFRGVVVAASSPGLRAEIAKEVQGVRQRFPSPSAWRSLPQMAGFYEVLRKVGVNPRREQPSVERLLRSALKRADLPAVNCLVDAYNLVSIRSLCSLGAHNLDRIACPVALRLLTGQETFRPLGRDTEVAVVPGEYGYVDTRDRVLCRLDLLQAEFSKVTAGTVNVLLIIEGTSAHPRDAFKQAFAEATDLVTRHCGGIAEVLAFPDRGRPV